MNIDLKIFNYIRELTEQLIACGLCDDQNFPSKKNIDRNTCEININNSDDFSFFDQQTYEELYNKLKELRVFNIKLLDGALIRFQYRIERNKIKSHILSYFPNPNIENILKDLEDIEENDKAFYKDVLDIRTTRSPLRFDFDDKEDNHVDVKHPKSHLTIGQYKNCRIPVYSALTPYDFIKFIFMNFYAELFYENKDKIPVLKNIPRNKTISFEEEQNLHLNIK